MAREKPLAKLFKSARVPRVWVNAPLSNLNTPSIELPKRAAHHLLTVLRAEEGCPIELFNGDGNNYRAILEKQGKKVIATIESISPNPNESNLTSVLVQGISRGDRMDTSVQKCVELGITHIQPVYTTHSIPALKGDRAERKLEHWQAIAISAAEQSGRSVVPQVSTAIHLNLWLKEHWPKFAQAGAEKNAHQGAQGWVLDPQSDQSLSTNQHCNDHSQVMLIGPESGLESNEIMEASDAGFTAIRFGTRILRTETAGPAVLTALQTLHGDLLS